MNPDPKPQLPGTTQARVLVVEDEELMAQFLASHLRRLDFTVVGTASDGEQALALVREQRPDLILMDVIIGGTMDGIDTAARIRAEFGIPVIFLTALFDEKTLDRACATEPYGYVVKPYRAMALRAVISAALSRIHVEAELRRRTERMREFAESSADWFWEQDANLRFTFVSPGLKEENSSCPDAMRGRLLWELPILGVSDDQWRAHRAILARHEPFRDFIYQVRNEAGDLRRVTISGRPWFGPGAAFLGYRGSGRDVTALGQVG